MTTWTNNAEGGTNGAAVTVANSGGASGSAFSQVVNTDAFANSGGAVTFSTAAAYRGALGYAFSATAGAKAMVTTGVYTSGYQRLRFYLRLTGYPSQAIQFVAVTDGAGSQPCFLGLASDGRLYLNDNNDAQPATTTNALPLNTWLRIEAIIDPDTSSSGGSFSLGYALGEGAMVETFTRTGQALGTAGTVNSFSLMKASYGGSFPLAYLDEIQTDNAGTNTTFIGPSSAGRFKVGSVTPSLRVGSTGVGAVYAGSTQLYP